MPKFRKRPVVIEAVQFTRDMKPADLHAILGTFDGLTLGDDHILIPTANGPTYVHEGDWICRQEVNGEGDIWPVAADIFAATYEPVPALDTVSR